MKLITLDNLDHFKEKLEELNATKEELNATKEELAHINNELNIAKKNIVPVGVIYPFGGGNNKVPAGYLPCDGRAVSRTQYSALFNVIGTSFGNGDGNNTFNVPDLRECVPVGIDASGRADNGDHDIYTLGQFKKDQLQAHSHSVRTVLSGLVGNALGEVAFAYFPLNKYELSSNNNGNSGDTTHGKQVGVNYIIKY